MNQRTLLFSLAAVAVMGLCIANPAFAQAASTGGQASQSGGVALSTLTGVVTGNIGLMLGLGITVLGLWTWIIGQKTGAGIVMILGGVLLTLAPGLFNGARNMAAGVVGQFGGNTSTVSQNATAQ